MKKSALQPRSRKTPSGGRKMARMILQMSEAVKGIFADRGLVVLGRRYVCLCVWIGRWTRWYCGFKRIEAGEWRGLSEYRREPGLITLEAARIGDGLLRHRRSPATLRNARESKQAGKHTHTHVQCRSRPPSKIASHSVQDLMACVTRKALTHHAAAAGVFAASNFAQRASGTRQLLGHEIPAPHGPHRHSSTRLSVVACPTVYIIARWLVRYIFAGPRMWLVKVGSLARLGVATA